MQTTSLFESANSIPFVGSDYQEQRDSERLTTQIGCIVDTVSDGQWRTIQALATALRKRHPSIHFPENSIQAQLRNLRKIGYQVEKRNAAKVGVLFEYRVAPPAEVVK